MSKKENLMVAKIICEVTDYLLNHHIEKLDTKIERNAQDSVIIFKIPRLSKEAMNELKSHFRAERDIYAEIYGIPLVGDGKSIDMIASLVDEVNILEFDHDIEVHLFRKVLH